MTRRSRCPPFQISSHYVSGTAFEFDSVTEAQLCFADRTGLLAHIPKDTAKALKTVRQDFPQITLEAVKDGVSFSEADRKKIIASGKNPEKSMPFMMIPSPPAGRAW